MTTWPHFTTVSQLRFQLVNFDDYCESELKTIWLREIESRQVECEDIATKVAAARLAKASGRKGFGNARDVRTQVICLSMDKKIKQMKR